MLPHSMTGCRKEVGSFRLMDNNLKPDAVKGPPNGVTRTRMWHQCVIGCAFLLSPSNPFIPPVSRAISDFGVISFGNPRPLDRDDTEPEQSREDALIHAFESPCVDQHRDGSREQLDEGSALEAHRVRYDSHPDAEDAYRI